MQSGFLDLFTETKPVIGVVHLKGTVLDNVMAHAKKEVKIYLENGVDGILFDNYSGHYNQLDVVLNYIRSIDVACPIGVHVLHVDALSFHLANKFSLEFLQVDSVGGHGNIRDEQSRQVFFNLYRESCASKVIGSVRFPQSALPVQKKMEEDLQLGVSRADAITVLGNKEIHEPCREKMEEIRNVISPCPLVLDDANEEELIKYIDLWDVAVIDAHFKKAQKPTGDIDESLVKKLMEQVKSYRQDITSRSVNN